MTEELLKQLRDEVTIKKTNNEKQNTKVQRIKELEDDPNVREYIYLIGLFNTLFNYEDDDQIVSSIYNKYIYLIQEDETNGIYVYLGTFRYSDEIDIGILHVILELNMMIKELIIDYIKILNKFLLKR